KTYSIAEFKLTQWRIASQFAESGTQLVRWETPRLCRGGSRSLTYTGVTGVSIAETFNREPPSKRKEELDGQDREPKSHEMGLQVSPCVYSEVSEKDAVRAVLRGHLGEVFHALAQQRESRIEEGHLMPDHVHMMISIPPKYAVSQVVGYIKGKSAIHLAR